MNKKVSIIILIAAFGAIFAMLIYYITHSAGGQEWFTSAKRLAWIVGGVIAAIGCGVLVVAVSCRGLGKPTKLYQQKKYEELILYTKEMRAKGIDAGYARIQMMLKASWDLYAAAAFFELKRDDEFLSEIEKITCAPFTADKYYFLTVYYVMAGDKEKAKENYELFKTSANRLRLKRYRKILEVLLQLDSYTNERHRQAEISSLLPLLNKGKNSSLPFNQSDRLKAYLSECAELK